LAIDADPDSNLAGSLGVGCEKTLGDIREDITETKMPLGVDKVSYLNSKTFEITVESDGFDLLVMGRPEGPGCYCALNHMLRQVIDAANESYDLTVIDAEAGLEHLSRRTTQNVDTLLVVTDPSRKGFETARRVRELAEDLDIRVGRLGLVLNRVKSENIAQMMENAAELEMTVFGQIPEDPQVGEYDLAGKPLAELPPESTAKKAVAQIAEKVLT